jgi:hypothetical protein
MEKKTISLITDILVAFIVGNVLYFFPKDVNSILISYMICFIAIRIGRK